MAIRDAIPTGLAVFLLGLMTFNVGAQPVESVVYDGYDVIGYGRHIVLIAGDEEYRSEEALPQLGKILAQRLGFKCTVLFSQDPAVPGIVNPNFLTHIPGLEALETADLLILSTRFRELPDDQMRRIDKYLKSGRPVVGLRTANHAFKFPADSKWAHYGFRYDGPKAPWKGGFGMPVLGSVFISHHGWHGKEGTRGLIAPGAENHPVMRGITEGDIWGATDVYGVDLPLPRGAEAMMLGQVLKGMDPEDDPVGPGPYEKAPKYVVEGSNDKNDPLMPVAWTKTYRVPGGIEGRVFSTSLGASIDLKSEGTRRLIVNGALWCLGVDPPEEGANVEIVGDFAPSMFGKKNDWEERKLRVDSFAMAIEPRELPREEDLEFPFLDPAGGRKGYEFADHPRNRFRLYDFYARAAEYYLGRPEQPDLLRGYPGLDGGGFGHWGLFSKNSYQDRSWNLMRHDTVFSGVLRLDEDRKGDAFPRAINFRLGDRGNLSASFDAETLRFVHVWKGGFLGFFPNRGGIGAGVYARGKVTMQSPAAIGWSRDGGFSPKTDDRGVEKRYAGHYRHGKRAVLKFSVDGMELQESPWSIASKSGAVFVRDIEFGTATDAAFTTLFDLPENGTPEDRRTEDGGLTRVLKNDGRAMVLGLRRGAGAAEGTFLRRRGQLGVLKLTGVAAGDRFRVYAWEGRAAGVDAVLSAIDADEASPALTPWTRGGPAKWAWRFQAPGVVAKDDGPFAIDRLPVPEHNPYGALMLLGGHDFYSNGDAAVCTMMGDVWRVSGLDDELRQVTWRRIATGLNQALGVWIERGKTDELYVLGRDRINRLHDLNDDGEIDFYENFSDAFETSNGGHDFYTGLQRDGDGNFYFAAAGRLVRVSADGRESDDLATGLRNSNGAAANAEGVVITSTNEGDWTPANMVIEVREGDFYGRGKVREGTFDPPMAFVPRGIENSVGGQVFVTGKAWSPLEGQLLSFSYGSGVWYAVLRDDTQDRTQGAVVPLPGDFAAGAHRGRFHPRDGQLYIAGSEGWGNYAIADASFDRVRLTGDRMHLPIAWEARANGVLVTLSDPIDPKSAVPERFFCQQWNYEYSRGYGSAEYSIRRPTETGHDRVDVVSVTVLDGGRKLFLEMPDIVPAMQMQIYGKLEGIDGEPFKLEMYPTVLELGSAFTEGVAAPAEFDADKPRKLALRIRFPAAKDEDEEEEEEEPGRLITIETVAGLQFATKEFTVKAGERISLKLENPDSLPHNLVILKPGTEAAVGALADAMITDVTAVDRHYVPDSDDVLESTELVEPVSSDTIHFDAPEEPGVYPYLCTFPGHWMIMRGRMIVE